MRAHRSLLTNARASTVRRVLIDQGNNYNDDASQLLKVVKMPRAAGRHCPYELPSALPPHTVCPNYRAQSMGDRLQVCQPKGDEGVGGRPAPASGAARDIASSRLSTMLMTRRFSPAACIASSYLPLTSIPHRIRRRFDIFGVKIFIQFPLPYCSCSKSIRPMVSTTV